MYHLPRHSGAALWLAAGLGVVALEAQAGGFALIEQGASGMGNAYAGAAAVSQDASTVWFNPAGMTELPVRELAAALHILRTDTDYRDEGSTLNPALGGSAVSGPETASPGTTTPLPNFYYTAPINDAWHYGLGISIPFGSSTEYDDDWRGRYTTIDSSLRVIDVNPSIAWRVSDQWRLGAGFSVQQLHGSLSQAADSGAVCLSVLATTDPALCVNQGLIPGVQANDGQVEFSGDSVAVGFNLGALFLPRPDTRLGITYRHSVEHELDGDVDYDNNPTLINVLEANAPPATAALADGDASADVELPAMLSFSAAHQLNERILLLGDITWAGWSSFEELRVEFDSAAQADSVSLQEWEDVWRFSGGISYAHSEKLTLRFGLAYDEEPIPSPARRTARIPGNDRTWVAVGLGYRFSRNASVDVGYTHLFLDDTPIDNRNEETTGGMTVRGIFEPAVDILSAQFNWQFN